MKKILYIPGDRPTGGVGAFMYNYHSNFDTNKIKIDYLLFTKDRDGVFDMQVKAIGARVYILPELKYSNVIQICNKLCRFFKENNKEYDAIHIHSPNLAFLCLSIARKYGIKNLIVHSHATMYSDKKINSIRNRILCMPIKKYANIYFACSKAAGEFLYGKRLLIENKVSIINNAIDCNKFKYNKEIRNKIREELCIKDEIVVGNVGRFSKEKNHEFILSIFLELRKKYSDSKLILVGDGPRMEIIKHKVEELKLSDSVIFLGRRNDIGEILNALDIYLSPSLSEGFGISLIEAQCTGLLTISSDIVPEDVRITDNIHLYNLNNKPKYWADEIINKYNIHVRKDECEMIKNAGFDIKKEAIKLQEYYLSLS